MHTQSWGLWEGLPCPGAEDTSCLLWGVFSGVAHVKTGGVKGGSLQRKGAWVWPRETSCQVGRGVSQGEPGSAE